MDPCIVVVRTRGDGVEGGAASIFSRLGFVHSRSQSPCSKKSTVTKSWWQPRYQYKSLLNIHSSNYDDVVEVHGIHIRS